MVPSTPSNQRDIGTLEGKVAVITGGSKGIGKAIGLGLAAVGTKIVLAARTPQPLEDIAINLRGSGAEVLVVPTDVTDAGAVERLVQRTLDVYERVDILINNAGIGRFGPVVDFTPDDWDAVVNSNLKAIYLCTRSALSPMLAQDSGQIINVLSIAAKVPFEASSAYCAAKAGALAFTKVLAREVREQNIRVTAVLPGSVHTSFWDEIPQHPDFEQMLAPEHVAGVVVSICQQPLGMVTEEIVVMPPLGIL